MKMILSILLIKDDISDDDNDENAGEVELLSSSEMNQSVQQTGLWKKGETKETQGSGNGLFAMEDVKKGDYIIEYVGQIVS